MATHLALDDELIEQARQLGGCRTKQDAVTQALLEYVQRRKQTRLLDLFGSIELETGFDPKAQREVERPAALHEYPGFWIAERDQEHPCHAMQNPDMLYKQ
ncbi:MAG: type II toxin-antitoxin system VapB family antitoxin [Rhodoferax sp.]